jgi:hypothetical protein
MDLPFIFYPPPRTRWLWWSTSLRRMQQSTARCRDPVAAYLCGGGMLPHACSELNGKRPEGPKLRPQPEKAMGAV